MLDEQDKEDDLSRCSIRKRGWYDEIRELYFTVWLYKNVSGLDICVYMAWIMKTGQRV